MEENNEQHNEMDEEANKARGELEQNIDLWSARALAHWWNRWYLKAGHRRLGRILVEFAKKNTDKR